MLRIGEESEFDWSTRDNCQSAIFCFMSKQSVHWVIGCCGFLMWETLLIPVKIVSKLEISQNNYREDLKIHQGKIRGISALLFY